MDSYRKEKTEAVKEMMAKLVKQGWEIDLSFVDYDKSVELIIQHEALDQSEASTPDEVALGDMRGLLRAVYLNGEKVFNFENEAVNDLFLFVVQNMAKYADADLAYEDEGDSRPLSDVQMNRDGMITAVEQLKPGKWLMIYRNNEPSGLVRVKEVMTNGRLFTALEWGKTVGIKEPGWLGECLLRTADLGIVPYASGLWETMSWAETVDVKE